jgi:DNA-binding transcriptional LysR family regulator
VSLTAAGEALLREAIEILDHEQRTKLIVQRAAEGKTGRLRIGYLSAACLTFLPELVHDFSEKHPEVQISLIDLTAQEQIDAFDAGRLDVSLSRTLPPAHSKGFTSEVIFVDEMAAFITSTHPLAKKGHVSLIDLKDESFVIFKRSGASGLFDQIIIACRSVGFSPHISIQPNTMQTVLTEVASGLGVSLAPSSIRNLNMTGCICLPIKDKTAPLRFELHRRSTIDQPAVEAFTELVMNQRQSIENHMALN